MDSASKYIGNSHKQSLPSFVAEPLRKSILHELGAGKRYMEIEFSRPHLIFTKISGELAGNQMPSFVGLDISKHLKSQVFKLTTITLL